MAKYPDYTQMMDWGANHPAILSWQIKTIAHQWQKFGYFIIFVMAICIIVSFTILILGYYEDWVIACSPLMGVVIGSLLLFGEVRRKCWMVYRFTSYGLQMYYWRAYPKSLFWVIRLLFVGLGVGVLITGIITEMGLLAIAGPVSIALALGSFAITKNYEKDMINFQKRSFDWEYVVGAQYDVKRNVIGFDIKIILTEQDKHELRIEGHNPDQMMTEWSCYVFPIPELTSQVIHLVESSLQKGVALEYKKIILPEVV